VSEYSFQRMHVGRLYSIIGATLLYVLNDIKISYELLYVSI
jgi:hypothetical protein